MRECINLLIFANFFQGLNLRITTKDALPYVGHKKDANGDVIMTGENEEVRLHDGMFVEAFLEIASILNFTYTAINPPDGQYGAINDDGTWNGMVGELARDNADVGKNVRSLVC